MTKDPQDKERTLSMSSLAWFFASDRVRPGHLARGRTRPGRQGAKSSREAGLAGPVHKRLGELAGTWDVAVRYIIGDKQHEGKATCEAKMILDGRFLQQDYTSRFQGQAVPCAPAPRLRQRQEEVDRDHDGQPWAPASCTTRVRSPTTARSFTNMGESTRSADRKAVQAAHRHDHHRPRQLHPGMVPDR